MTILFERKLRYFAGAVDSAVKLPLKPHLRQGVVIVKRTWMLALALLTLLVMPQLARGADVVGCVDGFPVTEIEAVLLDSNGRELYATPVRDDSCFGIQGISSGTYYIQLRGQFIETGSQQFNIDSTGTDLGRLEPNPTVPAFVALLSTIASASPDDFPQLVGGDRYIVDF